MKKWAVLFSVVPLLFLFTIASVVPASAGGWTGNANIFVGGKLLKEADWLGSDKHFEFGVGVDFRKKSWPVSIAVGGLFSQGAASILIPGLESETFEFDIGVRKIVNLGSIHPFVGGGVAIIGGELEIFGSIESDSTVGFWLSGGVYKRLLGKTNLGLELRYSSGEITLAGVNRKVGGMHIGLLLGGHF